MNRTPIAEDQNAWPPAEPDDDAKAADALRTAYQIVFGANGGARALADWGRANPTQFYRAYAHLLSRTPPAPAVGRLVNWDASAWAPQRRVSGAIH